MDKKERLRLRAPHMIVLGFLLIIVIGALLLILPFSHKAGISFTDALFTSASAVCVTGLVTVNIAGTFTVFGQVVIMLLIQAGGLGFMTVATLVFLAIGKRITLRERMAISDSLNQETNQGVVRMTKKIILGTLIVEAAGFLLFLPFFIINFGGIGVWKALFTAVSAFCNCGMDLMEGAALSSLTGFAGGAYYGRVAVLLSASFMVFLGGLGFAVILDILKQRRFSKFKLHTKLVLTVSAALLLSGFIVFFAAEYNNPSTLGGMGFGDKVLNAFVLTVNTRSAGFTGVSVSELSPVSRLFAAMLMFIGASPASTGGGIKTTTAAILVLGAYSGIRGREEIVAGKRTIPRRALLRSLSVLLFALCLTFAAALALLATEGGSAVAGNGLYSLDNIVFEAIGAFSTAGLSMGVTPYLSAAGKYIVMLLMFCGRLGPIAIGLMFMRENNTDGIRYPDAHIMIG